MMRRSLLGSCAAALVIGCGGGEPAAVDASSGASADAGADAGAGAGASAGVDGDASVGIDSGVARDAGAAAGPPSPAHAALPQLIDQGGPILTAASVVSVTFPGDSNAAQLDAFGAQAANNAWWAAVCQEYCETDTQTCVGAGAVGTSVALTSAPGSLYTDSSHGGPSTLQTYIRSLVSGGQIAQPGAQTILAFYFPRTTTITLDDADSCVAFGGFHNAMTVGGVQFMYVVVNDCPPDPSYVGPPLTALQRRTLTASHEIVEAATDPFVTQETSGFYLDVTDPSGLPWNNLAGGEVADLCVDILGMGQDQATEGDFTVQRSWSNAAARAGGDPCVPASTSVYFNAAPETWLLKVPVGGSATFTADAFSSAATADWIVFGADFNATETNDSPYLTITVNGVPRASVNNGDKITVSVTLNQDPSKLSDYAKTFGATGLLVSADRVTNPTVAHVWPFLVVTPDDAKASGLGMVNPTENFRRTP